MRIIDFVTKAEKRFSTNEEKEALVENLFKRSSDLHINDLELALILFVINYRNRFINILSFFKEKESLLPAIVDSSYAKFFAPDYFVSDIIPINDEKWQSDLTFAVLKSIAERKITAEGIDALDNHELLVSIDLRDLDVTKKNIINASEKVKIVLRSGDCFSFALSQAGYQVVSEVILTNMSSEPIRNSKLVFVAEPNFIEITDIIIPLLNPDQPVTIEEFNINSHLEQLLELTEKTIGKLTIKFVCDEDELVSITSDLEYFSYDTCLDRVLPCLSAMFVTPNDIAVENLALATAKEMQTMFGDPSITDYQSDNKESVVKQIKAAYCALHNEGIVYTTAPPSYESVGQKVRMPHKVIANKQGTCFDLALLFASVVENIGLNPFLVFITGHAFVGVFLERDTFPTALYDDASHALEMASDENNNIIFVECTKFVANSNVSFEEACEFARTTVSTSINDPQFQIIDIQRARARGILPLPINFNDMGRACVAFDIVEQNKVRLARKKYSYSGEIIDLDEAILNKFDVWEKKLLDLTKRNQLINYNLRGKGLQLYLYNLDDLFHSFVVNTGNYHLQLDLEVSKDRIFELPTATEEEYSQIERDFANKNLRVIFRHETAQKQSPQYFYKEIKKSFEETGSNIFYLAIGFIQYFENDISLKPLYAPIILVPIDLIRHSKDNFSIRGREEPPFFNISIFEFLHQTFGIDFDDILTQVSLEGDVDVNTVLNTVASRTLKLKRATIVRTAAINIFNFSKAVMWSDVRFRKNELAKNKVVESIIKNNYSCNDNEAIEDTINDDVMNPEDLAIPLPADSSQIMAIQDCAKGKSFILQGPPGTGKSQTITNMIVNAIYHGKTVLFVAEKMAALEVVQKRLNSLSLGQFALEAHSAKSDKASLMEQFEKRIDFGLSSSPSEDFASTASKLKEERKELNRVIDLLHKENGLLFSFFTAFNEFLSLDEDISSVSVPSEYIDNLDLSVFNETSRLCKKAYNEIISNGGFRNNVFALFRKINYIPGVTKTIFKNSTDDYKAALNDFRDSLTRFCEDNDLSFDYENGPVGALLYILSNEQSSFKCLNQLLDTDFSSLDTYALSIFDVGINYQKNVEKLLNDFSESIFDYDFQNDYQEYKESCTSFFIKRFFKQRAILNKLSKYLKYKKALKTTELETIFTALEYIKENEKNLIDKMNMCQIVFGSANHQSILHFKFDELNERYNCTKGIVDVSSGCLETATVNSILHKLQSFTLKGKEQLLAKRFTLIEKSKVLVEQFGYDYSLCELFNIDLYNLSSIFEKIGTKLDYLPMWSSLLGAFDEIKKQNADFVIDYILKTPTVDFDLELVYKKSIYAFIVGKTLLGDEAGSFNSNELQNSIEHYRNLIDKFAELTIKETAARVSSNMPQINADSPTSSQQGILNKAIKNKCRGKAIRQLFAEVPEILTKLFPVFLMSPMSCAQYLSPYMPKFDIVIFDEASQMPTSEAIGAIARGKSLIVVGDSQQMPPSAFFQSKGSEDLDADIDDQENILEDCCVIGMPCRSLNWHYRSKHESLIRFSNAKFYKNGLVTFPSPNDKTAMVKFVNTHGIYGEKKATNPIEAAAIIKEIERRLKDPALREKSIGVVTFSSVQQEMIEDMLSDFFSKHKELEKFDLERKEPIIVKNLENIQGDERSVILFSVCYGPDKTGKMHYRFGPLNSTGGEKRLNVAVSRAREEMVVFASFEPELLSNMKSESRGANEFFNFLKYAKYGSSSLTLPNGSAIENKIGFEKQLAEMIEDKGYKTDIDIGKSSFKVDIGVIDPKNPDQYILGILCDSYSYQSALTSKDRNVVQPSVLDMLGWNVMRVWSFDFYDIPEKVIHDIVGKIKDIQEHPEKYKHSKEQNAQISIDFEKIEKEKVNYSKEYQVYSQVHYLNISSSSSMPYKIQIVREIMELESPISEEILRNRFANAMGAPKAYQNIKNDLLYCLQKINAGKGYNFARTKTFFWREGQSIALDYYRIGGSKPRSMDNVPKEEIIVAIKEVISNYGNMFKDELKSYVAEAFGIRAVGRLVNEAIEDCVACYLERGVLEMVDNNSRIALKENKR